MIRPHIFRSTKKPERERKLFRCLAIFIKLQNGPVRINELAGEFSVCNRSILRDLHDLDMAGSHLHPVKKGVWEILR